MPPEFHTIYDWSTGSTWIADGSDQIARIEPPRLRDMKFKPGGDPIGTWLTLFWWQYVRNEEAGRSAWITDELKLNDHDPERYRLMLRSHNSDRSVHSLCDVNLTYDEEKQSYLYDVRLQLEVQPQKEWLIEPSSGVEFANPWFIDSVGSSTNFPGSQPPRWNWVVYTGPTGKLHRLPLNHLGAPPLEQIRFPSQGGWLGFFDHPDGNPVIELDAETSQYTRAEVCAWGYDTHFIHRILPENSQRLDYDRPILWQSGRTLSAHYRLYCLPARQSQFYFQQAEQIPLDRDIVQALILPAFVYPLNTFHKAISPDRPDNAWYWTASHTDTLTWERDFGHSERACLCVENSALRLASWQAAIGPDFWMQPFTSDRRKLSCWIRTDMVQGEGAYLSFRYSNYEIETGQRAAWPEKRSTPMIGSQDWTRVEIELDQPPAGATRAYIQLNLSGTGKAWFDDVAFVPIQQ